MKCDCKHNIAIQAPPKLTLISREIKITTNRHHSIEVGRGEANSQTLRGGAIDWSTGNRGGRSIADLRSSFIFTSRHYEALLGICAKLAWPSTKAEPLRPCGRSYVILQQFSFASVGSLCWLIRSVYITRSMEEPGNGGLPSRGRTIFVCAYTDGD